MEITKINFSQNQLEVVFNVNMILQRSYFVNFNELPLGGKLKDHNTDVDYNCVDAGNFLIEQILIWRGSRDSYVTYRLNSTKQRLEQYSAQWNKVNDDAMYHWRQLCYVVLQYFFSEEYQNSDEKRYSLEDIEINRIDTIRGSGNPVISTNYCNFEITGEGIFFGYESSDVKKPNIVPIKLESNSHITRFVLRHLLEGLHDYETKSDVYCYGVNLAKYRINEILRGKNLDTTPYEYVCTNCGNNTFKIDVAITKDWEKQVTINCSKCCEITKV